MSDDNGELDPDSRTSGRGGGKWDILGGLPLLLAFLGGPLVLWFILAGGL